jgi:hypothetical protein
VVGLNGKRASWFGPATRARRANEQKQKLPDRPVDAHVKLAPHARELSAQKEFDRAQNIFKKGTHLEWNR